MMSILKYSCLTCKLTLSILYCHPLAFPCWSIGWGCHLIEKITWSGGARTSLSTMRWVCWEFSAISLAIALSSGWRVMVSAASSRSKWVGEAGRRTGAKAWLSKWFFPMNKMVSDNKIKNDLPNDILCILDLMQRECRWRCDRTGTTALLTFSFTVLCAFGG